MVASNFPNRPFGLREGVWLRYQDINGNTSHVSGELWIDQYNGNYNTYSGATSSFSFHLNGSQVAGWNFTFDFRSYDNLRLCYVEVGIGHNADGTKYFSIDGYANVDIMGYTEVHSGITLPTIPRASTATWAVPGNAIAGVAKQLNTNRASASFTHDIDYYFGATSGRALTGAGASGNWTPPLALLNQIPNAAVGTGKLRTHTYNGGQMIGWTESTFNLEAAADIVPNWTSATIAEATPNVQTIIGAGRYLQNISKLTGTITGAAGVYGSTISSYRQSVGTEVINAATAAFTKVLAVAGTAVPVTQEITDSRGRKKTLTTNINVMPYSLPVVSSWSVQRADSAGTPAAEGTNLRINIVAAVQSIINSTERNRLTIQVYTKLRTDSTWTLQATPVNASTTLGYSNYVLLAGPFGVNNAYDVQVKVTDRFTTTTVTNSAGVGRVYMHWGDPGFGIGKYYERGMLDIQGDIYTRGSMYADQAGGFLETGISLTNCNTQWMGRFRVRGTVDGGTGATNLPAVANANDISWTGETFISNIGFGSNWRTVQRIWPMSDEHVLGRGIQPVYKRHRNGAGVWTPWTQEIAGLTWPAANLNASWNWLEGRMDLTAGSKVWIFDGVFTKAYTKYRIDYYYYSGSNNGNWFRFRTGGADISTQYNVQSIYLSGTGTPQGAAQANLSQVGMAAHSVASHHGYIEVSNPMLQPGTTIQKGYQGRDNAADAAMCIYGGWLGGQDNVALDGFKISLSDQGGNGVVAGSWISIRGIA